MHSAVQLQPRQQTTLSLRASQYKPPSKRKRDDYDDEDVEEPPIASPGRDAGGPLSSSNAQSPDSLDTVETAQLRVAGILPTDEFQVPPPPFPHAPARGSKPVFNYTKLQQELAGLDPPLYAVNGASKSQPVDRKSERPALRQEQLGVLSTMMHYCLLQGNYHRAGRAWGLILRTQIAGLPIDPRNHGRWGIGAELLLRRNAHSPSNRSQSRHLGAETAHIEQSPPDDDVLFTREGFELAREYYERLIVQHPNRKHLNHSVDDGVFYPAMFSLWIYEVVSIGEDTASEEARTRTSAIKEKELRQAREISSRIDQLVVSPPFDKHAGLLRLRGMVALWIGDLLLKNNSGHEGDEWDYDEVSEIEDEEYASARRRRYADSLRELKESQVFFGRAHANGQQRLGGTMSSVDAKIKHLTTRLSTLGG
ncbi:hypothetical protein K504DRAFT_387515 [Pleomassaria siparia CBS 279.74]|uniref:Uncharacterized protein n=1 Tax=Pleomassaria siparia CBS 279.74 TaxID=1314801 RepID=A0A6G1JZ41_9PLEO|nr:hypothetical protein K504DRAFT_387515 [Pleomassaria siparia CBS 279.74]